MISGDSAVISTLAHDEQCPHLSCRDYDTMKSGLNCCVKIRTRLTYNHNCRVRVRTWWKVFSTVVSRLGLISSDLNRRVKKNTWWTLTSTVVSRRIHDEQWPQLSCQDKDMMNIDLKWRVKIRIWWTLTSNDVSRWIVTSAVVAWLGHERQWPQLTGQD